MNILFIWTGVTRPLYEWRIKCIRRALEVYPDANFKVITTLNEFFGMEVIDAREILDKLNEYDVDIQDPIFFSDYARYYWLARNPRTLYIDTDALCTTPIPEANDIGHDDYWAIWNGDDLNGIQEVLNQHGGQRHLLHTPQLLAKVGRNLSQYFIHKPSWRKY
jgi:hypothetical protein